MARCVTEKRHVSGNQCPGRPLISKAVSSRCPSSAGKCRKMRGISKAEKSINNSSLTDAEGGEHPGAYCVIRNPLMRKRAKSPIEPRVGLNPSVVAGGKFASSCGPRNR